MSTRVAEALGAYPLCAVIKVDDTPVGIGEGLNAGMWTVGVAGTGNELGLDAGAAAALAPGALAAAVAAARARFIAAGAHFVVDSVADLPAVIAEVDARLAKGETPLGALPPAALQRLLAAGN